MKMNERMNQWRNEWKLASSEDISKNGQFCWCNGILSLAPSLPLGEVQAFHDDLNGKLYINEVYKFSVDKLYDLLFTESQFMRDFLELRRFSGERISVQMIQHCWSLWEHRTWGLVFTFHLWLIFDFLCRCGVSSVEEGRDGRPEQGDHVHHRHQQSTGSKNCYSHWDSGNLKDIP